MRILHSTGDVTKTAAVKSSDDPYGVKLPDGKRLVSIDSALSGLQHAMSSPLIAHTPMPYHVPWAAAGAASHSSASL
eukprot:CAMPEP_0184401460 /NCGR_PEP_ID=MMETSP0007-20130409/79101_1 /TAXON_ID=97485 /ORGANISM="Prymnesium parvum, Strain Texoma1" /LENGTH=76 /DNA_ID=CAMNT_0026756863 /DNA_START=456 /DNA_END=683 /DNA_ORIENTATION=+